MRASDVSEYPFGLAHSSESFVRIRSLDSFDLAVILYAALKNFSGRVLLIDSMCMTFSALIFTIVASLEMKL